MAGRNRLRGAVRVVGSVTAATSAFSGLCQARAGRDRLLLANAVAAVAMAVTGALIAVRALRGGDDAK